MQRLVKNVRSISRPEGFIQIHLVEFEVHRRYLLDGGEDAKNQVQR